jgi:hypothetical protein
MMWGAISDTGRTELVDVNGPWTVKWYCDEILQHYVVPIMQNKMAHCSSMTTLGYIQQGWQLLIYRRTTLWYFLDHPNNWIWTPQKHLWGELDRRVRERQPVSQSLQKLVVALQTFRSKWSEIWRHRWGDAAKQLLMIAVNLRDIEKQWPWPVDVQRTVVENETVDFDVSFNDLYEISYIFSVVLVLHSGEKFIMRFFFWRVYFVITCICIWWRACFFI